jgi:hypothetical protein
LATDLTPEAVALGYGVEELLRVRIEWIPEELRSKTTRERGEILSLVVTLPLRDAALMRREPFRIVNPTSKIDPDHAATL